MLKIDFFVWPIADCAVMVSFNSKSSVAGAEDHVREHGTRIPCLVVFDFYTEDMLCDAIMDVIDTALAKLIMNIPAA